MQEVIQYMGLESYQTTDLDNAFGDNPDIGLGDWRIYESNKVVTDRTDRWRKILGKSAANRIMARVKDTAEKAGYELPRLPKQPDRAKSLKQYKMAKQMMVSISRSSD